MADKTTVKFDDLPDFEKEGRTPRGEYKNPAMLDQGNGLEGAPSGPQPAGETYVQNDGKENTKAVGSASGAGSGSDDDSDSPKSGRKRTA